MRFISENYNITYYEKVSHYYEMISHNYKKASHYYDIQSPATLLDLFCMIQYKVPLHGNSNCVP